MDRYIHVFGNGGKIGVVIGIRSNFGEGLEDMEEAEVTMI